MTMTAVHSFWCHCTAWGACVLKDYYFRALSNCSFSSFQGLPASGCRFGGGPFSPGGRLRHWHRRRRRRPRHRPAAQIIRRHDPDPHFRRSLGSLRTDRGHFPLHEELKSTKTRYYLPLQTCSIIGNKKCFNLFSRTIWPKIAGIRHNFWFHFVSHLLFLTKVVVFPRNCF